MKEIVMAAAGTCLLALTANANSVTFITPTGSSTGGGPVNATATFVTSANTVTITLTDLQANPTDIAQLISDLTFTLSTGQNSGTLASSSGNEITINGDGTFTTPTPVSTTHWQLSGLSLMLTTLGNGQPTDLIIGGPGANSLYSNANGSIAGNGPHNPFLQGTAIFVVDVAGVTDQSVVNGATFSFGTEAGINVTGVPTTPSVPDGGTTALLLGSALSGLALLRRKVS